MRLIVLLSVWIGLTVPVLAQTAPGGPAIRPPCGVGFVQNQPDSWKSGVIPVAYQRADFSSKQVRIEFVGHSSFLVTSPAGVKVITDYNWNFRAETLPDIATMSSLHPNHMVADVEPEITHGLYGWDYYGRGTPRHDVTMEDVRVYSAPANLSGGSISFFFPTSVFIIESNGLCIAHLGLLGHVLDESLINKIGRVDILMTPVDRRVTQSLDEIIENVRRLDPKLVIPMHYNSEITVEDFIAKASAHFTIRRPDTGTYIAEKSKLPAETEILHLKPPFFTSGF